MELATKVLLVEDDDTTAEYMYDFLVDCGFEVVVNQTITDALSNIKNNKFNILLLDLNLPDFSGFDLLRNIKNQVALPIIVISAYSDTKTKVQAFKYGASDYMVKPVELEELEARIWSLLGRFSDIKEPEKKNTFEIVDKNILFQGEGLSLTSTEYEILAILIKNKNQIISRDELANSLSTLSQSRSLDYHIKNIRGKIGDDGKTHHYLKTEYGVGYKLVF